METYANAASILLLLLGSATGLVLHFIKYWLVSTVLSATPHTVESNSSIHNNIVGNISFENVIKCNNVLLNRRTSQLKGLGRLQNA